jgi:hypothetical protein
MEKPEYIDIKLTVAQVEEMKKLVAFEIETEHLNPTRKIVLINTLCKLRRELIS